MSNMELNVQYVIQSLSSITHCIYEKNCFEMYGYGHEREFCPPHDDTTFTDNE